MGPVVASGLTFLAHHDAVTARWPILFASAWGFGRGQGVQNPRGTRRPRLRRRSECAGRVIDNVFAAASAEHEQAEVIDRADGRAFY